MKLDESAWIYGAGLTPDWTRLARLRREDALAALSAIDRRYARLAPATPLSRAHGRGLAGLLRGRPEAISRLTLSPALDYWLFCWETRVRSSGDPRAWETHFGLFQGIAAAAALIRGRTGTFELLADADAHIHFYGLGLRLELPRALKDAPASLALGGDKCELRAGPLKAVFPRSALLFPAPGRKKFGPVSLFAAPRPAPGIFVEECGPLLTAGVAMHGLARLGAGERTRFSAVLGSALEQIRARDSELSEELRDMVMALIPLRNEIKMGSVSSSYADLRGAICLSHSEDALLQAETLIHEYCHQKMNQLLVREPLLVGGQSGQVFYSPWRKDARRLRGLILGAHAFLNVARYLMRSLSRERHPLRVRISLMSNAARRLFEIQAALDGVCAYGALTEFGMRFILGMRRELAGLFHGALSFPPELLREAGKNAAAHRREHALPWTGMHKARP